MPKKQQDKKLGSGAKLDMKKINKNDLYVNQAQDAIPEQLTVNETDKKRSDKKDKKDKKQSKKQLQKSKSKDKGKQDKKKQKQDKKKKKNSKDDKQDEKEENKITSSLIQKQKDPEIQTIHNIKQSQQKTKGTIQALIEQYKNVGERILFNNHGSDPEKETQIQKQLTKLQKQKQERHKKLEQLHKHKQQLYESREKQKEVKRQLRRQKIREKKLSKIEERMKSLEQNAQHRKQDHNKFIEYVKERKKVIPRYKKYDEQYKRKLEAENEKSYETLQEIKKKYRPLNQQELQQFDMNYKNQLEQGQQYRSNKLRLEAQMLNEQNKIFQKQLWKGRCHQIVKQEISQSRERKQQLKLKMLNRKQFGESVVQQLRKEIISHKDEENNQETESYKERNDHTYMRQKYFQGVNFGLVAEEKIIPLPLQDKNRLGNGYLERAKQINRHRKNKTIDYSSSNNKQLSASQQLKQKSKTFKIKRKSNPYYIENMNHLIVNVGNYESIDYAMEKIGSLSKQRKLQDQIIKHGQHKSIIEIQQKKRRAGKIAIKQINDKLNLLEKL